MLSSGKKRPARAGPHAIPPVEEMETSLPPSAVTRQFTGIDGITPGGIAAITIILPYPMAY